MSLNLNSQSFINAFKDKMLEAGIPADKHYLFNQSSQLEAFRVIVSKSGVTEALTQIDDILLFKSYIQVRALKQGASIVKALLFNNILKLRAYEAGASITKALKTTSLKYVQNLEKRQNLGSDEQPHQPIALIGDKQDSGDIAENLKAPIKYHVVSDIDDVLCREVANNHSGYVVDREWVNNTYSGVEILTWQKNDNDEKIYFCYPGFDKLALAVSSWSGWSIDFFSAEVSSRNEKIVPDYFIKKLGYQAYSSLVDAGKLNIFSEQHLTKQDTAIPGSYRLVKNLNIVTSDVDNAVLVDDTGSNAAKDQEQVIGLSIEASKEIIAMVRNQEDNTGNMPYNPLNNSAYVMGVLLSAKELLDNNDAYCLREAIDITMRYNGLDDSKCASPWYVYPTCALKYDPEYLGKLEQWVSKGQDYLDHF